MQKYLTNVLISLIAATLFVAPTALSAQDAEPEGHFFTISTYTVSFSDLTELSEMWEEDMDLTRDNEFILSSKVMVHQWGSAWSYMTIEEFANFSDINAAQKRGTELYQAKYKEGKVRDDRNAAYAKFNIADGHADTIVKESLKLTK